MGADRERDTKKELSRALSRLKSLSGVNQKMYSHELKILKNEKDNYLLKRRVEVLENNLERLKKKLEDYIYNKERYYRNKNGDKTKK